MRAIELKPRGRRMQQARRFRMGPPAAHDRTLSGMRRNPADYRRKLIRVFRPRFSRSNENGRPPGRFPDPYQNVATRALRERVAAGVPAGWRSDRPANQRR